MYITPFDLEQLTPQRVEELSEAAIRHLLPRALDDLREARDRLNQTPRNSSRPSGSMPVWDKVGAGKTVEGEEEEPGEERMAAEVEAEADDATETTRLPQETPIEGPALPQDKEKKKPGRQKGMVGHGRTQALPVTAEERHLPGTCRVCNEALPGKEFVARFGFYSVGLVPGAEQAPGLGVTNTKHLYGDITCQKCGHCSRSEPGHAVPDALDEALWPALELTEWRLVEPYLASFIAFLYFRAHCSYTIIQELLEGWCGIQLSTATLNHTVHELGYAAAPVEEQLAHEIVEDCLVHGDETSWLEAGEMLWLWVFITSSTCLYQIGSRGLEIIDNVLGGFLGRLMSDGYVSYRHFKNRLRCWAHLLRKAIGLAESTDARARAFGKKARDLLERLMAAIYEARESPPAVPLPVTWAAALQAFRQLCEEYAESEHAKTGALAREFLNDWEVIWAVLADPSLPLTNNLAERALRHWVIARRISYGTRTPQGSRAFALLASVIDTCRLRGADPWGYLASVLEHRRQGKTPPPLPLMPSSK
jgi:transposase